MRGRILVVDDDEIVRSAIARVLADEGYTVDIASDGVEALVRVEDSRPEVILLDVLMPRMNGKQVLEVLRTDPATCEIPVLVMTTVTGIAPGPTPGATDLVEKPFEVEELLDKVALAIYRARAAESRDRAGIVFLVHPDLAEAARIEDSLGEHGFTAVCMNEIGEDLLRLARVLEPRAVVIARAANAPTTAAELELLQRMRSELAPAGTPILLAPTGDGGAAPTDAGAASEWATGTLPAASADKLAEFIAANTH